MKLYQKLIVYALTVLPFIGCDYKKMAQDDGRVKQTNTTNNIARYNFKNYFTSFGELSGFNNTFKDSPLDIELADLDGDGDLDVILTDRAEGIVWAMENRIPQKGK